ncbi:hypothetical protein F5Y02DRAFT_403612 [Annulohypoxylon stygium]|nr:hypothetical protein F5Y02DRAFT_403612 [Annulohypoxylon stygium]
MSNESDFTRCVDDTDKALIEILGACKIAQTNQTDLPPAFLTVARTIPSTQTALEPFKESIREWSNHEVTEAKAFRNKATQLSDIFERVIKSGRGADAYSSVAEGKAVEILMRDVIRGIIAVTDNNAYNQELLTNLSNHLTYLSTIPNSLGESNQHSFHNSGPGGQSIHLGKGHIHNNNGSGTQINGDFKGPISIGQQQPQP